MKVYMMIKSTYFCQLTYGYHCNQIDIFEEKKTIYIALFICYIYKKILIYQVEEYTTNY
jgi:hypothetical protein